MLRNLTSSLLLLVAFSPLVQAQDPALIHRTFHARELIESAKKSEQLVEQKSSTDPNSLEGQGTPLATLIGLRDAMRAKDYDAAGESISIVVTSMKRSETSVMKHSSRQSPMSGIDRTSQMSPPVSDRPEGDLTDGLPEYRDQIGSVQLRDEEVPIYLQRIPDGRGGRIWKLSNATVARVPEMWDELGYSDAAISVSRLLPEFRFLGIGKLADSGIHRLLYRGLAFS